MAAPRPLRSRARCPPSPASAWTAKGSCTPRRSTAPSTASASPPTPVPVLARTDTSRCQTPRRVSCSHLSRYANLRCPHDTLARAAGSAGRLARSRHAEARQRLHQALQRAASPHGLSRAQPLLVEAQGHARSAPPGVSLCREESGWRGYRGYAGRLALEQLRNDHRYLGPLPVRRCVRDPRGVWLQSDGANPRAAPVRRGLSWHGASVAVLGV